MIQDIAWSPRLVGTTTATAASAADVTAGTSTSTFVTPAALAGSSPTFGGNLTVSGGTIGTAASTNLTLNGGSSGASLVLGQGSSGTATITGKGTTGTTTIAVESTSTTRAIAQLLDVNQATNASLSQGSYMLLGKAASANNSFALMFNYVGAGSSGNALSFQPYGATSVLSIMASGNLLIGATADGGNGKLQLATHTTSAGGIGFGTDVSLYRSNTRELTFLGSGSSTFIFAGTALGSTVSLKLGDGTNNDQGIIESQGGALVFKRNTYTALTLDSSQNATFAGRINVSGSGQSSFAGSINATIATAGATQSLLIRNTDNTNSASNALMQATVGGASAGDPYILLTVDSVQDWNIGVDNSDADKFKIGRSSSVGTNTVLTLDTSGNATVSGSIAIGNTVNTVSPTSPNRTITMVIGGTTYYLHAKTTND